jgi:hypothetical protein
MLHHRPLDLRELRRTVADLPPLQPQTLRHERPQMRLVEIPRRLRRPVELRAVQRREPAIRTTREVRRDDVRVQLRVKRTAHPVPVRRRDQPVPALHVLAGVCREAERSGAERRGGLCRGVLEARLGGAGTLAGAS